MPSDKQAKTCVNPFSLITGLQNPQQIRVAEKVESLEPALPSLQTPFATRTRGTNPSCDPISNSTQYLFCFQTRKLFSTQISNYPIPHVLHNPRWDPDR